MTAAQFLIKLELTRGSVLSPSELKLAGYVLAIFTTLDPHQQFTLLEDITRIGDKP